MKLNSILETALTACRTGLSVHPPVEDGTKAPLPVYPDGVDDQGRQKKTWLHPSGRPADEAKIRQWYGRRRGVGIRTGSESDGLECLEFDDAEVYSRYKAEAQGCGLGHLVERIELGYCERTPGDGVHWLYYTTEVRGNTKLARRPAPTETNPRGVETLIETRGENGFIIIAPSGGPVHQSGRPYVLISGGFDTIPSLTGEDRDALFELARSFDQMPRPAAEASPRVTAEARPDGGEKPGEAFERRTTWAEILEPAGWTLAYRRGDTEYWRRPEKAIGISATTNHGGSGLLWVFSSSTSFDTEKSYSKFGALAVLEHGGNFAAAAKDLGAKGYGDRTTRPLGQVAVGGGQPIPRDDATRSPEWPTPRLGEVPTTVAFPIESLPGPVAKVAQAIASSIGCPVDFAGLSLLVVAGSASGRSASLLLKPGYFASAALYGMNVGNAASGKTPALAIAVAPLLELNAEFLAEFRNELAEFEKKQDEWEHTPKSVKPRPPRPERPRLRTVLLNDCTTEVVKVRLSENPRGLLNAYDEGSAWVGGLNQYKSGKGTDRQFYLSALNGSSIRVDRMKDRDAPTSIRHPFLSILGNMTPEMLGDLREGDGRSDGFVERILFAFVEATPRAFWNDEGFPPEAVDLWRRIVRRLFAREPAQQDGADRPHIVRFSPEAKQAWVEWFDTNVTESRQPGYEASELSVDGKLENYTARLALILHLLELACDESAGPGGVIPDMPPVTVAGAIELWHYFRTQHRRVRWYMNGGIENREARAVLGWITRHGRETFTRKELTDDLRWLAERPSGADGVLAWMEERHILRKRPAAPREPGQRGQCPSPTFEVNPSILAPRNTRNTRNSSGKPQIPVEERNSAYSAYSAGHDDSISENDGEVTWRV